MDTANRQSFDALSLQLQREGSGMWLMQRCGEMAEARQAFDAVPPQVYAARAALRRDDVQLVHENAQGWAALLLCEDLLGLRSSSRLRETYLDVRPDIVDYRCEPTRMHCARNPPDVKLECERSTGARMNGLAAHLQSGHDSANLRLTSDTIRVTARRIAFQGPPGAQGPRGALFVR